MPSGSDWSRRQEERARGAALRIAMVAPPWFELPPAGYGGIESVVADLVDGLVDRGHEVTLIGSGKNRTRASRFVSVFERPPSDLLGAPIPEVHYAAVVAETLEKMDLDLVHDHSLAGPLLARGRAIPTIATMHGPVRSEFGTYFERLGQTVHAVAISDSQRQLNPDIQWRGTVHNAIDVASYPYWEAKSEFLLWLGRFSPEKGAHLAIETAREAGISLVLAGKCNEPEEQTYFKSEIEPRLGRGIHYVGEANATQKRTWASQARALIFPIQWDEPFGMVMIEAMACGTPVVALKRGSVPEIVVHGRTGLVVDDPADLVSAVKSVSTLKPVDARRHVETSFDLPVMAANYERLYLETLTLMTDPLRGELSRTHSSEVSVA
jgi:glycosyltransferase involved in cell wall biosynthesis